MTQTRPKIELAQLCEHRATLWVSIREQLLIPNHRNQNIRIRSLYYTQLAELGITENQQQTGSLKGMNQAIPTLTF